jgi:hypothetical protein
MSLEKLSSTSIMSFKEYYDKLVVTKKTNLQNISIENETIQNDYGWFVDLEEGINSNTILNTNIIRRIKTSQYISIPETINEFPSIKSFNSIKSLNDSSMFFKMDDIKNDNVKNDNVKNDKSTSNFMTYTYFNICGLMVLMLCCIKLC